jgi:predicted aspartyl protease
MAKHYSPRPNPNDLEKFGPRIDIEVGPPIIPDQEKRYPRKFSRMPALIDSGAGRTVLTPEVIKMLSLPLVDYTTVARAGGIDRVGVHVASIQFPLYKMAPWHLR